MIDIKEVTESKVSDHRISVVQKAEPNELSLRESEQAQPVPGWHYSSDLQALKGLEGVFWCLANPFGATTIQFWFDQNNIAPGGKYTIAGNWHESGTFHCICLHHPDVEQVMVSLVPDSGEPRNFFVQGMMTDDEGEVRMLTLSKWGANGSLYAPFSIFRHSLSEVDSYQFRFISR